MAKRIKVKPGKTQSKLGFFVGIGFCILGLVVVVPTFGVFGIFWTAVAGFITYTNYKNAFTEEGVASHVIEVDEDDITVTRGYGAGRSYSYDSSQSSGDYVSSEEEDVESRLEKLQSLYSRSLITYEEYEAKKKEILEDL